MSDIYNINEQVKEQLEQNAWEQSNPFCYQDYITVKPGEDGNAICHKCGSDDLMRELSGVGVEYGIDWVMAEVIQQEWEKVSDHDMDDMAEELIDEINEPFKIGSLEYSAGHVLRQIDEFAFNEIKHDLINSDIDDGRLVETSQGYYRVPVDIQP